MDESIQFLVEVKTVSDVKDMCKLQVEIWEPAGAALQRLNKLAGQADHSTAKNAQEAEPQKYSWGFGDKHSEPAHRPATRGLDCGAATGWTYVEEGELGSVVALNVGGKLFTASYDTFTRIKDSLLAGMLCGRFPVSRDFSGNIFIDRDPKIFRSVLNYLRDETIAPPKDHDLVCVFVCVCVCGVPSAKYTKIVQSVCVCVCVCLCLLCTCRCRNCSWKLDIFNCPIWSVSSRSLSMSVSLCV